MGGRGGWREAISRILPPRNQTDRNLGRPGSVCEGNVLLDSKVATPRGSVV